MTWNGGGITRACRAVLLLLRNARQRPAGRTAQSRHSTAGGTEYDLYEPRRGAAKTLVAIAGLTLLGERDPRLVNFCRSLAESGFRVAAPALAGLESFRYEIDDGAALAGLVTELAARNGMPVGIVAFSAGGGIALAAAADPATASLVDPLLLFGPYYSLPELWERFAGFAAQPPATDGEWDHYVWIHLALAYRAIDSLSLEEEERTELVDLLTNYCWEPSWERKRRFYEQVIKRQDDLEARSQAPDARTMAALSPQGRLENVTARVLILHDSNDHVIPPRHSIRLHEELCSRGMADDAQRVLVTPFLSHVTAGAAWRFLDLFRIPAIVGELFR